MDRTANRSDRPKIALTLGDPVGIGPEVVLKALADDQLIQRCDITVVGSRNWLRETYRHLLKVGTEAALINPDQVTILNVGLEPETEQLVLGQSNAASGSASFEYLETAIAHTLSGDFQAIVTGPIAKSAWKAAGHDYPGQTELLAHRSGVNRFGMLFVAQSPYTGWTLRTLLATTHIPLRDVADTLTVDLMTQKLDLLIECLQHDFGLKTPRIAIAGLNPHSGEQGQLGREEQEWLTPWLEQMRDRLPDVQLDGPIPPDTLWVKPAQAWYGTQAGLAREEAEANQQSNRGIKQSQNLKDEERDSYSSPVTPHSSLPTPTDAYLALYHDQGLIPVKLMAFDRAVNTSIGLPFVRTSPDHGTAFDIAGRGIADATSMKAAIKLAVELSYKRYLNEPSGLVPTQPQRLTI